jgi:hypothetical protein
MKLNLHRVVVEPTTQRKEPFMAARPAKGGASTLPMTVNNTAFLLDRLGQDCHPLQYLRELTQNSIDAISRTTSGTGEIIWDVDWNTWQESGVFKLCVLDTGVGMTGPEMVEYINQLSRSVSAQSIFGNYGVGAKIAAATRNHIGMIYLSWKNSQGAMVHLWRNPETGVYGLKRWEHEDGTVTDYLEIVDDVKPPEIIQNGTKIVLLGNTDDENTMQAPEGVPAPSRWIAKCLNSRYFRFPDGIKVKAREGWENPRSDGARNKLRTVTGQEKYLKDRALARGKVQLLEATAHWWILEDSDALSQESNYYLSAGHVAALYRDELYEVVTSKAGSARLQQFGVIFGYRRVVIYIEPLPAETNVLTTNTARTSLSINNEPLPWAEWACEFRENMPEEIDQLIKETAAGSTAKSHTESIRDRLKQILDLYRLSRYRPTPNGILMLDDDQAARGGKIGASEGSAGGGGASLPTPFGRRVGSGGNIYSLFEKNNGVRGQKVRQDPFPKVNWISVGDGTREPGMVEDRAAKFIMDQNLLLINADFRVFNDMISRWHKEAGGSAPVREVVVEVVRGWFEQALVETVIGIQALQNAKEWSIQQIQAALSEEALTTAVMQRYHVNNSIKRELSAKLGKLQAT